MRKEEKEVGGTPFIFSLLCQEKGKIVSLASKIIIFPRNVVTFFFYSDCK